MGAYKEAKGQVPVGSMGPGKRGLPGCPSTEAERLLAYRRPTKATKFEELTVAYLANCIFFI